MVVYSDLDGPDGLLQWVEELEAEAVLLGGPLNQLAGIEQHCPHPLSVFVGFINEQDAWFQHTPQLRPALQSATDLEWSSKHSKHMKTFHPCHMQQKGQHHGEVVRVS